MTYRLANATRSIASDAIGDALDGGSIQVRTSAQPTNVDDAAQGTLLGTVLLGNPAFGASTNGSRTSNSITPDSNADNSGTAEHFRALTSGGAIHSDGSCGQGSGELDFDNNVIVAGGTIAISSIDLLVPAS